VERYLLALADWQEEGRSTHSQLHGALETYRSECADQSSALESAIRGLSESSVAHGFELDELRRFNLAHVSRFEQGDRLLATLEVEVAQAQARHAELSAELGRLALRLDAADATQAAALVSLEASIGELRKHVQRHLVEVQTAMRSEQIVVDALMKQFEILKRSPWRLWWPGTKRISPVPLPQPGRVENGGRPAASHSAPPAPVITSLTSPSPALPSGVPAMRFNEANSGKDALVQLDSRQFVASAYRMILGREADFKEQNDGVDQLQSGIERWEILAALAKSDEAADRRVLWSDVANALLSAREGGVYRSIAGEEKETAPWESTAASATDTESLVCSTSELLELHDEQFVRTCFRTLLHRPADPEGLSNYLGQVRAGIPKSEIVADLVLSPEGRKVEPTLHGLAPLVEAARRARPNMLQRLLRWLGRSLFYPVEVRLNALENRLYSRMRERGSPSSPR